MLNECVDNTCTNFEQAVESCLDIGAFLHDPSSPATLDDEVFRDQIYIRVVKPLEESLQAASRLSSNELDSLTSTDDLWKRTVEGRRREHMLCPYTTCKTGMVPFLHTVRPDCQADIQPFSKVDTKR